MIHHAFIYCFLKKRKKYFKKRLIIETAPRMQDFYNYKFLTRVCFDFWNQENWMIYMTNIPFWVRSILHRKCNMDQVLFSFIVNQDMNIVTKDKDIMTIK